MFAGKNMVPRILLSLIVASTSIPLHAQSVGPFDKLRAGSAQQVPTDSPDTAQSECDILWGHGYGLESEGQYQLAYDTLRMFLERCPSYPDGWRAFSNVNSAVSQWVAGGAERFVPYVDWLKQVLYLNADTNWYCADVMDMFTAFQTSDREHDAAIQEAIAKYILENNRCPSLRSTFVSFYNSAASSRHQTWRDSIVTRYMNTGWPNYVWRDSVRSDTLANPYDSTYLSIDDYGLSLLRGKHNASVTQSAPVTGSALGAIRVDGNPFDAGLSVTVSMNKAALVTTELRDLLGRSVPLERARYRFMQAGVNEESFSTSNVPVGTYYLRVSTDGGEVRTLKLVKQ